MLRNVFIYKSITTKLVFSILLNTILLLIVLSLLINQSYIKKVPIESKKIALSEIEKIASSIAYPLWYLDSAHVLQIIKDGIEKSELLTFISVKTRIENRDQPVLQIAWGQNSELEVKYSLPINFHSSDSTLVVGELSASFIPNSQTIKNVIKEQFKINTLVIILFTTLLILIQIFFIRFLISRPLKAVKNSLIKFKETGIREKVDWNSKDELGEFVSVHNQSIDHSNKLENDLSEAKSKAEKANLAKSIFLSHMSHELRTPLTAILGFTQILKEDKTLNSEQEDYIKTINTCGDHLLNLINNILTLSKIESGELEIADIDFNIRKLLTDIISVLQVKANEKNLYLNLSISNNLPERVVSDENKIRQILFNLIGNAIKFTVEGGIAVKVKCHYNSNKTYTLKISVTDTGPGIPEHELNSIFLPFKQSSSGKNSINSTGLGLPICNDFIKLMGGKIEVQNNHEGGSTFLFDIKVAESNEETNIEIPSDNFRKLNSLILKDIKVLIIEDTTTNIYLLKKLLEKFKFNIEIAENGEEGIIKYKQFHPQIAFVDKNMPIKNGEETIIEMREIEKKLNIKTSIISLTADTFTEDINTMIKAGANFYMKKPFTLQELYDTLYSCVTYLNLEK